jgi:hypothetical protein
MDQLYVNNAYRGHVNQTIWGFSGDSCTGWVEIGVTWGYPDLSQPNQWLAGYAQFIAFSGYNSGGGTAAVNVMPQNGSHHSYMIYYWGIAATGEPLYQIYWDGGHVLADAMERFRIRHVSGSGWFGNGS